MAGSVGSHFTGGTYRARVPNAFLTWPRVQGPSSGVWLVAAVVVGGFHLLEHVIQVSQRYLFGIASGNGLAGSIADIEPVHFIYNFLYLGLVIGAVLAIQPQALARSTAARRLLTTVVVLQIWHVFEHVVKMIQYVQFGGVNGVGGVFGSGPGGILPLAPIPLLHLGYNLAVYVPFVAALMFLRPPGRMGAPRARSCA